MIAPNLGFWRQLIEYESAVRGKNSVRMGITDLGDEWPDILREKRGERREEGGRKDRGERGERREREGTQEKGREEKGERGEGRDESGEGRGEGKTLMT